MTILDWFPLTLWLILWVYWFISALFAKKSVRNRSWWFRSFGIRFVLIIIAFVAISFGHGGAFGHSLTSFLNDPVALPPGNLLIRVVGVVLCAAGVAFAIWARATLGKNWGMPMTLRETPELVTSGPYRYVRHPIYGGFFIAMFGTALTDGVVWALILIAFGIYFIFSARTEEKMMAEQFPNEYPEYMKHTKMLIPFVL